MEYVEGSIAALVSGNVTPNGPKLKKRPLAPVKHQPSPNVTPKCDGTGDRSIFASPTQMKKKDILKKSPKRIFENVDIEENDTNMERVKKRLNSDLENIDVQNSPGSNKKKRKSKASNKDAGSKACDEENVSPKKQKLDVEAIAVESKQKMAPKSPKGKKNKSKGNLNKPNTEIREQKTTLNESNATEDSDKTPKKKRKRKPKNKKSQDTQNGKNPIIAEKQNDVAKKSELLAEELARQNKKKNRKNKNQKLSIQVDKTGNNDMDNSISGTQKKTILEHTKKVEKVIAKKNKRKNKKQNKVVAEATKEVNEIKTKKNKAKKAVLVKTSEVADEDSDNEDLDASDNEQELSSDNEEDIKEPEKQGKARTKKMAVIKPVKAMDQEEEEEVAEPKTNVKGKVENKVKQQIIVNPNAVTDKDSASEHESDDDESLDEDDEEIEASEDESSDLDDDDELKASEKEPSSDVEDDDEAEKKKVEKPEKKDGKNKKDKKDKKATKKKPESTENPEEEAKRTLFVGNVPFSKKTKKSIKTVFDHYGEIDSIRIRAIPVKDEKTTQRLAAIKHESHPDRTTANVYIKYKNEDSVTNALVENNTLLDGCHLRVTRTTETGALHDPKMAIFVGNMPFAIEDELFRAKFEKCGPIQSVRIIRDKKTNIGKGFGYVNFESKDGVELALTLTDEDLTIKNRILRVKRCTNLPPSQNSLKQGKKPFKGNIDENRGKFGGKGNFGENRGKFGGKGNFGENREKFGGKGNFGENREKFGGKGNFGENRGKFGGNRGKFGEEDNVSGRRNFGDRGGDQNAKDGAARRVMNKRKFEENPKAGPPQKRPRNLDQPSRDKNKRKEFVGLTAEKKTKKKFDKGQKKRKAISEILSKL